MDYLNDYLEIVDESYLSELKRIFCDMELRMDVPFGIRKVEIKNPEKGLPYIMLSVDYNYLTAPGNAVGAMMLIVDIDSYLLSRDFPVMKKLPAIAVPFNLPRKINKQLNLTICLEHELLHLHDMIEIYQRIPLYQTIRYQLKFESCNCPDELKVHTGMELGELFHLEPIAHGYNYDNGERTIFDYYNRKFCNYPAKNKKEYVRYSLLKYINAIENEYKKRAQELKINKNLFKTEFNKVGKEVYGNAAYEKYRELSSNRKNEPIPSS